MKLLYLCWFSVHRKISLLLEIVGNELITAESKNEMVQHTEDEHIVIASMHVLFDQLNEFLTEIAEA